MRYHKYFLFLIIINLSLNSCSIFFPEDETSQTDEQLDEVLNNPQKPLTEEDEKLIENRCITDRFAPGQDDNLYGKRCLEGKKLVIQTSKEGPVVDISNTINNVRIEGKLDFITEVYSPQYTITKGGDDDPITFLRDLLPEKHEFHGSLDTKYDIIFETTEKLPYLI